MVCAIEREWYFNGCKLHFLSTVLHPLRPDSSVYPRSTLSTTSSEMYNLRFLGFFVFANPSDASAKQIALMTVYLGSKGGRCWRGRYGDREKQGKGRACVRESVTKREGGISNLLSPTL